MTRSEKLNHAIREAELRAEEYTASAATTTSKQLRKWNEKMARVFAIHAAELKLLR